MPQKKTIWQRVSKDLCTRLSASDFDTWFGRVSLTEQDGSSVILSVPNKYVAVWLEDQYLHELEDSFSRILKHPASVTFHCRKGNVPETNNGHDKGSVRGLDSSKTFSSFHTGAWNRFAYSSAVDLAEKKECIYNPLYIFCASGLGKTHLLQGIGNRILELRAGAAVRYMTSTDFTSEFIHSWRNDQHESFQERYAGVEVILFDDLHLLSSRPKTQHAFLSLFDHSVSQNRKIVISADTAPHHLIHMTPELKSRVASGLIAEIQSPDPSSLLALTRRKAREDRVHLPEDVIFFLSQSCSDIQGLFKNIAKIETYTSITGGNINLSIAKSLVKGSGRNGVSVEDIQSIAASYFNISQRDLVSGKKKRSQSYPRQIAMYLARKHTSLSFKQIGEAFGRRDHSTVLYAVRQVEKARTSGGSMNQDLTQLENLIC
ncbi:MAG: chromosomal replication initiator protein DnaA [Deltaproteobacteria bacterium]|nr:chromosomal replication initiator protein DnaA [Deltaproteobacteria bacterium]